MLVTSIVGVSSITLSVNSMGIKPTMNNYIIKLRAANCWAQFLPKRPCAPYLHNGQNREQLVRKRKLCLQATCHAVPGNTAKQTLSLPCKASALKEVCVLNKVLNW